MKLVDTPKAILGYWSVRAQVLFVGISAMLAAAWGVLQAYPEVASRWASYLGISAESPQAIAQDLMVASLLLNVLAPIVTTILRALKQGKTYEDAADDPPTEPMRE